MTNQLPFWNIISLIIFVGICFENGHCQTTAIPTVNCTSSPGSCQNGGTCEMDVCQCPPGFKGDRCGTFACDSQTCRNGGDCANEFEYAEVGIICFCMSGTSGTYCDVIVNPECSVETCINGGSCASIELGVLCVCPDGFLGETCEIVANCINTPEYCENGATCIPGIEGTPLTCQCASGFTGSRCQIFSCEADTCINGGQCASQSLFLETGLVCNCPQFFTGTYCEIEVSDCNIETCLNGGSCASPDIVLETNSPCVCPSDYTGTFCETKINCVIDPTLCQNNGECVDGVCNCKFGFTGGFCELYECTSSTCQNGGFCESSTGTTDPTLLCECPPGHKGTFCEEVDQEAMCIMNCIQGSCDSNHTCVCDFGYRGTNCNEIIYCFEMNCQNGGECIGLVRRKRQLSTITESGCSCPIEYTGLFCEMERPPCDLECQNNGQCVISPESFDYYCECNFQYYYGEFCENVFACGEIRCEFGFCQDGKCVCPEGRYGGFCENDICATNPCNNRGLCIIPVPFFSEEPIVSSEFQCACPPGFRGPTCDGVILECGRNEFACTSGECIPLSKKCDNVDYDCADNSDEQEGECKNAECGDLWNYIETMARRCGDEFPANDFNPRGLDLENIFAFTFVSDFPNDPNIISKIDININPFFENYIKSDGTLVVAFVPTEVTDIQAPVFYFKILYEQGEGRAEFVKNLTDNYNLPPNGIQLVSLSFLPENSTDLVVLPTFECFNLEISCVQLTMRLFQRSCTQRPLCPDAYGEWLEASDKLRDLNCGITSIDSVVDPLYQQCLVEPVITSVSTSMSITIDQPVTLYCVVEGVPTPIVQWVEIMEDGNYINVEEPSSMQSVYALTDTEPARYACRVENVANTVFSEDVDISTEDPACVDKYSSSMTFQNINPNCYNNTITSINLIEAAYISTFDKGSVLYGVSFFSSNIIINSGFEEPSFSSFSTLGNEVLDYYIFSIALLVTDGNTGSDIYREVFEGIVIQAETEKQPFLISLQFDQPIKINSTSSYEFRLDLLNSFGARFSTEPLDVMGVTCQTGIAECMHFLTEWNELISDQINAGCTAPAIEYLAAELCFGEFFDDPEVIRHPESQASTRGLTSTLECNIENVEFYEWFKNGDVVESSGPTYSIQLNNGQDQGDYACFGFRTQDLKDAKSNSATLLITGISTFRVLVSFNLTFEDDYNDRQSVKFQMFTDNLQRELQNYLPSFDLYITSLKPGSIVTEMEIYFSDPTQNVNVTTYSALINDSLVELPGYQANPETIVVTSISSCTGEDVVVDGIVYTFTDAVFGTTAESIQACPLYSDQGRTVGLATRYCGGDFTSGAVWGPIMISSCDIGTTSMQIQRINEVEINEDNGVEVADALATVSSNTEDLDDESVTLVANILEDIVNLEMPDEMITLDVVEIVDNIIESGVLGSDPMMRETASSVVTSLERQLATVAAAGMNFTDVQPHIGVMTLSVNSDSLLNGLAYVASSNGDSLKESFEPDDVITYYKKSFPFEMVGASIALPPEIVALSQAQTGELEVQLYFTVYQNSSLFISNKLANESGDGFKRIVGSQIISASIEAVKISGLLTPIKAAFLPRFETSNNTECVFWDFSLDDGVGEWSSEGCMYDEMIDGRVICLCDHLTNFAILVDYYNEQPKDTIFQHALTIISLIGCIVSIVCLAITIVTYLYFKQFRNKRPQRILINLSISLLLLYLVFAVGIEQTESRNGCIAVAALIHYFGLASIFWMSIEAINMYLMFVKVFYDDIRYFMLKVCLVGYGFPLIIVAVCLGIDVDHYANENYCFIPSGDVRNYGFILIIGVLLLFNCVVFVLVMRTLTCGRKIAKTVDQSKREQLFKRLQNAVAVSVLLGLTWIFGFLAIDSDSASRDAFQLLFCIFNSLQGLSIFILFCLRQKDIRDAWKSCCKESEKAKRVKYATDTSNSRGKVKDQSIPLTNNSTHSTNTIGSKNEHV